MADVRVVLKLTGLNRLMRSPEVQQVVDEEGRRRADLAGEGFEYVARPHKWTARGYIETTTARAMREQAKNAVLERVMGVR